MSGLSGLPVGKGKLMVRRVPAMMAATLLKPVKVGRKWRMDRTTPNLSVSPASPTWWKSRCV
ncbi:unnamed protein product [Ectocarpus sp. 12 AP-2014]